MGWPEYLAEFESTLPDRYRARFAAPVVAAHAEVARRRGDRPASVGDVPATGDEPPQVVVVADDRPGLLAMISAALVESELDVIDAEAFTRRTPAGRWEAVDVFWVRPRGSSGAAGLDPEVPRRLESALTELITGRRPLVRPRPSPAAASSANTTVRFIEGTSGNLSTLEVETGDRSGLLLALSSALYAENVQIVGSEVRTQGAQVLDRFHITELDGGPIRPERRLSIQVAVLSAVQPS